MYRVLALAVTLLLGLTTTASATIFLDEPFAYPNGLITNGYAYDHADGIESPIWEVSSGSLFASGGWGYTGQPDNCATDRDSVPCTMSATFRAFTDQSFTLLSAHVKATFKPIGWTNLTTNDGIKLWNRLGLQGKEDYVALVDDPTGRVYIKKKCAGGTVNGGTYYTLADDPNASQWTLGTVHTARFAALTQTNGSVILKLFRDGVLELQATDNGVGCAPLLSGQMGVRSDDAEFMFDDFQVTNS